MSSQSQQRAAHCITRLRLRLHCDDRAAAQTVQQRASQLFHQRLQTELGMLVQQIAQENANASLSVDQLVLAVGEVKFAQFDEQLCARAVQQLGERLRALLGTDRLSKTKVSDSQFKNTVENKTEGLVPKRVLQAMQTTQVAQSTESTAVRSGAPTEESEPAWLRFIVYLQTGIWTQPAVWHRQLPGIWLQTQLQQASKEWVLSLAFACLQPQAIRRLLRHFDAISLRAVHQVLSHALTLTVPAVTDWTPYLRWAALQVLQQERVLGLLPTSVLPSAILETPPIQEAPFYWQDQIQKIEQASDWPIAWQAALLEGLMPVQGQHAPSRASSKQGRESEQNTQLTRLKQVPQSRGDAQLEPGAPLKQGMQSKSGIQSKQDAQPKQDILSKHSVQPEQQAQLKPRAQAEQIMQSKKSMQMEQGLRLTQDAQSRQHTQSEQTAQLGQISPLKQSAPSKQNIIKRITQVLHQTEDQPFSVSNAGLILLWPLLPRLLDQLGVFEKQRFVSMEAQLHAVCCLDWVIWESQKPLTHTTFEEKQVSAEWRTPLTKVLCGVPVEMVLSEWTQPDAAQQQILRTWLSHALKMWQSLERFTERDSVALFLQRAGMLTQHRTHWQLNVERDASDVLLSMSPWPIGEIRLPWLAQMVKVVWLSNS